MLSGKGVAGGLFVLALLAVPCVAEAPAPLTVHKGEASKAVDPDALRLGLARVAQSHYLRRVWFRLEENGAPLANLAIGTDDPDLPTPVASLSKSITAIGIALLIQEGRLSLNSRMGDVLKHLYQLHGRTMDATTAGVTIEDLLTHTAGLKPNTVTDPVHGVPVDKILREVGQDATLFDFLIAEDNDQSTGTGPFAYSNYSYQFLGLVIEAVSGENYAAFCQRHIFSPLGISDETVLSGGYQATAPFLGWVLSRADIIRIWTRVFDLRRPTLLNEATLRHTLLGKLGVPLGTSHDARYTLGTYLKRSSDGATYRVWHNGIHASFYTYVESTVPGNIWAVAMQPMPNRSERASIEHDIRALVNIAVTK